MKKSTGILILATAAAALAAIPAFAGTGAWMSNDYGYWWQRDDGSYPVSEWKWIDGNCDGVAECYHFDAQGYLDMDTLVDGYYVDSDGAWAAGSKKYTMTGTADETGSAPHASIGLDSETLPAVDPALEGNYEMHTELVDSFIHIENGRDGQPHLYFQMYGVHEDGANAEVLRDFYLQDLGVGQFGAMHHYIGDEVTYSGDTITFDWAPGMTDLVNVVLNGAYLSTYVGQ
jgi:hypothetical protein